MGDRREEGHPSGGRREEGRQDPWEDHPSEDHRVHRDHLQDRRVGDPVLPSHPKG